MYVFSLLKKYDFNSIKYKIITIYILNVLDYMFTKVLLGTGIFTEANFFMNSIMNNLLITILIKIVIPAIVLVGFFYRLNTATKKQIIISNIGIDICLVMYSIIVISHLVWCCLALYLLSF